MTNSYYGKMPDVIGFVDLDIKEMMFWMYCPIKTRHHISQWYIPKNLEQFLPLLTMIPRKDLSGKYVYITAKRLWVDGDCIGQRHGWHTDGFGTDDINYIWYDKDPTLFMLNHFQLSENCQDSIAEMNEHASDSKIVFFPEKHLLRLDPYVVHRCQQWVDPGYRTFVKISLSKNRYNLEGNSINHGFPEKWDYVPRGTERNHPSQ